MTTYPREEIEAAFAEYQRLGAEQMDWSGWAKLFTDEILRLWEVLASRQDDTDQDIRRLNKKVRELEKKIEESKYGD